MGYCMTQRDTSFRIRANKVNEALKAVQSLHGKETISDGNGRHFYWVSNTFWKRDSLPAILKEWRWEITFDECGDVENMAFAGEKIGDEMKLFGAIAPFVEKGSFIEMDGEDGCMWRWVFDGMTCKEISPTITW